MHDGKHKAMWAGWKVTGLLLAFAGSWLHQLSMGRSLSYSVGSGFGTLTIAALAVYAASRVYRKVDTEPPGQVALLPFRWFKATFILASVSAAIPTTAPPVAMFVWSFSAYWGSAMLVWRAWMSVGSRGGVGA